MGGKLKHRTSSSREAAPAKPKLSCTCSQPPLPQTRLLACLLSCIESREGGPHCALCSSASDVTGGAPVSHMFKWLPKAFRSLAGAGTVAKALERPVFSTTPKGLPKSGWRWDCGEGGWMDSGKNQLSTRSSKQGSWPSLALVGWPHGGWMGVNGSISRCQELKNAKKVSKKPWFYGGLRWFTKYPICKPP